MNDRHNFYREIHKAVRSLLSDLTIKSGRVDFTDPEALDEFRAEVDAAFAFLSGHAHHENDFIDPLYRKFAADVAATLATTHDAQEETMERIAAMLAAIDPKAADAAIKGHAAVVALSRLTGEFLVHMADEEEVGLSALWDATDDATLEATHHALLRSIGPDEMGEVLTLMLPAINTPERVAMLAGMRAGAPAEVFDGVRALARMVLTADDAAALERGLNADVAA